MKSLKSYDHDSEECQKYSNQELAVDPFSSKNGGSNATTNDVRFIAKRKMEKSGIISLWWLSILI